LQTLLNQADLAYRTGRLSEAELLYVDWLKLVEGQTEVHVWQVATCLQRLGDMYNYSGRYIEADRSYSRLLMLGEKACGLDQPELSKIRATLAQVKAKISDRENPRPAGGSQAASGSPEVVSDGRMTQAPMLEMHQAQQQDSSGQVPAALQQSDIIGDGNDGLQNLFGLTDEERRPAIKPPEFKKLRGNGDGQQLSKTRKSSPAVRFAVVAGVTVAGICLCIPSNAAGYIALAGDMQRANKSLASAVYLYDLAARLNPRSADIACKQARLKLDMQQSQEAIADFSRAIAINPKASQAYFERGMARSQVHDYQNALADFSSFIAMQPGNAPAYVRRGSVYSRLGQYDNAVKDYDKASKLDHTNVEAMYYRSWTLDLQYDELMEQDTSPNSAQPGHSGGPKQPLVAGKGDPQKIHQNLDRTLDQTKIALLDDKIHTSPKDAGLYRDRAWLSLKLGKLKAAIADYDAAIALKEDFAGAYVNRGLAYFGLNQYDKAIRDYSQGIVLDGENASAYYRRAVAFERLGKYDLAANDYQKASGLNPHRTKEYLAMAEADRRRLRTSQKDSPTQAGAPGASAGLHALASADSANHSLSNSGDNRGAVARSQPKVLNDQRLEGKSSATASDFQVHYDRGQNLAQQGHPAEAVEEFRAAIKCNPPELALAAVYYQLGKIYLSSNDSKDALIYYDRSISLYAGKRDAGPAYSERGLVYFHMHDYNRALADLNEAIRLQPIMANSYFRRARTYKALGQLDQYAADAKRYSEARIKRGLPVGNGP